GDRLEEHRHAVELAVHLQPVDAELGDVAELARQLRVESHQEVRPYLVAELVVWRGEEVWATACGGLGLEFVEDLIERDLKDGDLRARVGCADLVDELVEGRFL